MERASCVCTDGASSVPQPRSSVYGPNKLGEHSLRMHSWIMADRHMDTSCFRCYSLESSRYSWQCRVCRCSEGANTGGRWDWEHWLLSESANVHCRLSDTQGVCVSSGRSVERGNGSLMPQIPAIIIRERGEYLRVRIGQIMAYLQTRPTACGFMR